MGVKKQLSENYPKQWQGRGYCLFTKTNGVTVGNLVTKQRYFHKPALETLQQALEDFRTKALEKGIKKIVMPKIGCGLDKLDWEDVRTLVQKAFENTDIEVVVRFL